MIQSNDLSRGKQGKVFFSRKRSKKLLSVRIWFGEELSSAERLKRQRFSALFSKKTILVADPPSELRWFGRIGLPHVFDAEHYFLLAPVPTGRRLVQGEHVQGVALWFFDPTDLSGSFDRANQALSGRAVNPQ